jgi:hypothetical protein
VNEVATAKLIHGKKIPLENAVNAQVVEKLPTLYCSVYSCGYATTARWVDIPWPFLDNNKITHTVTGVWTFSIVRCSWE